MPAMPRPAGDESHVGTSAASSSSRPHTVLVINNNPDCTPGRFTPMLMNHLRDAGLLVHEVRTVQAVVAYAAEVAQGSADVGLIVSCGSPVVLTEPVDLNAHVTKTTAAMLHFPNAPVVGICFGMQLLALLYGGSLVAHPEICRGPCGERGAIVPVLRTAAPARLLQRLPGSFLQWQSNYIFSDRIPSRFTVTAVDSEGRAAAMEHVQEHVYGVLFHPEVLGEGVSREVLDRIIGLAGCNRRMHPQRKQLRTDSAESWQCSADCPLRLAVRNATTSADRSIPLAERLANAKREALAKLQRDHCFGGGITIAALEDAIRSLSQLAGTVECDEQDARTFESDDSSAADSTGVVPVGSVRLRVHRDQERTCTPHDADLRLREAVKDVLRRSRVAGRESSKPRPGGSSRATSVGSSHTNGTLTTGGLRTSKDGVASGESESESREATDAPCNPAAAAGDGARQICLSMHEADLRLRRAVQEALLAHGGRPSAARALASARREALGELRRARRADGAVPSEALEGAAALLRAAAAELKA